MSGRDSEAGATRRAILLERHGGVELLRPRLLPRGEPGAGEVGVRVRAIGVNYAEVQSRRGLYGWAPPLPYVLGMEACGEITGVGPGVAPDRLGERVVIGAQYGCYTDHVVVPSSQALPALEGFSDEENAAFLVNYLTAWIALVEMARLREGDRLLVTAAAGGVGTAAVQIGKRAGARVIGGVGSRAKLARVLELGAEHAVCYGDADLASEVRGVVGETGVDVVLETVGGAVFRQSLDLLAPFGRMVVAGFAGFALRRTNPLSWWRTYRDAPRVDLRGLAVASRGVLATHIGYLLADPPRLHRVWSELVAFTRAHGLRPVIGARFRFDEIGEAHRLMESRASVGKLVVALD
jgi:NADPH2:quinone reductase